MPATKTAAEKILRVNKKSEAMAPLSHNSTRANKGTKGKSQFIARVRDNNEALPANQSWLLGKPPYRTGDGDTHQPVRPGSMTAYSLPSKGTEV